MLADLGYPNQNFDKQLLMPKNTVVIHIIFSCYLYKASVITSLQRRWKPTFLPDKLNLTFPLTQALLSPRKMSNVTTVLLCMILSLLLGCIDDFFVLKRQWPESYTVGSLHQCKCNGIKHSSILPLVNELLLVFAT